MTAKQTVGSYAPDASKYGCVTDGAGNLVTTTTFTTGSAKQNLHGSQAPDGSIYFCLTDGNGTLA